MICFFARFKALCQPNGVCSRSSRNDVFPRQRGCGTTGSYRTLSVLYVGTLSCLSSLLCSRQIPGHFFHTPPRKRHKTAREKCLFSVWRHLNKLPVISFFKSDNNCLYWTTNMFGLNRHKIQPRNPRPSQDLNGGCARISATFWTSFLAPAVIAALFQKTARNPSQFITCLIVVIVNGTSKVREEVGERNNFQSNEPRFETFAPWLHNHIPWWCYWTIETRKSKPPSSALYCLITPI
jgi:hypothetical protein